MVYFLLKKVRASYFGCFPSIYILNFNFNQFLNLFFIPESTALDSVFRIKRNLSNQKLCHVKSCFSNREHVGCFSKRSKWQIFVCKKLDLRFSTHSAEIAIPGIDFKTKQNFGYTFNSVVLSPVVQQDIFQFLANPSKYTVSNGKTPLFNSANRKNVTTYYNKDLTVY